MANAAAVQFAARQDIATSAKHLTGLAVADFNGDGKPDIAVTDDYSQVITVYLNDGSGGFSKSVTTTLNVPSIGGLGALVAGDVNEDGKQDLIVAPVAGLQYDIVLLGNGDGTFTQKGQISTSYGFGAATLIDVNGDKHLDLIAGGNGSVYVHLGDGTGNFTGGPLSGPSGLFNGITAGDFNGDHRVDFIASDYIHSQISVFTGSGDGTFTSAGTIPGAAQIISPGTLASADFNGDGKLDLLMGGSDYAQILLGIGDGTFQTDLTRNPPFGYAPDTTIGSFVPVVATADMDGNNTPDVVVADDGSQMLSISLNNGKGAFTLPGPDFHAAIDAGTGVVQLADLNGDGLPDIILTNYKTQKISIFVSITPTPTLSIQSSALQALVGTSPTLTVKITSGGSTTPTGTVSVTSGTSSFGQQALDATGSASFTLQNLAAGQYPLKVAYSGDKYNAPVTSNTVTQTITDFQASLQSATQTVGVGMPATYIVNLTPEDGFTESVALSCSGLPTGYSCASVTATVSGTGGSFNVIVSPPASTASAKPVPRSPFTRPGTIAYALLTLAFLAPGRRRRGRLLTALLCLAGVLTVSGCSGSGNGSGTSGYTGTTNFVITASATQGSQTVSHQVTATLVVH